ncbi:MAG: hypothetical protein NVSMB44_43150 [Ktedonobacteraceae bacterium]
MSSHCESDAKLTGYTRQSIRRLADYEKEWVARITQPLRVEELTNLTLAPHKVRVALAEDYA